jgi:hypothetical protein
MRKSLTEKLFSRKWEGFGQDFRDGENNNQTVFLYKNKACMRRPGVTATLRKPCLTTLRHHFGEKAMRGPSSTSKPSKEARK